MIIFPPRVALGACLVLEVRLQRVRTAIHAIIALRKSYLILVELFLDELIRIAQLRELYFLLLYDEGRELPFALLLVPLGAVFYFIHLLVIHQILRYLLQEIKFFGLLPHSVKQLLVARRVLIVYVLELVIRRLQLLLKFLDDFAAIFYFLLDIVVLLFLLEQLGLLPLLLLEQEPLLVLLFLQFELHFTLGLRLLALPLFKSIAAHDQLRLHILEQILQLLPLLGFLLERRIRLLDDLLLLGLLLEELLGRLDHRILCQLLLLRLLLSFLRRLRCCLLVDLIDAIIDHACLCWPWLLSIEVRILIDAIILLLW